MRNVTLIMNRYRECARNIWNVYFNQQFKVDDQWTILDEYDNICVALFSSLVLNPISRTLDKKSTSYEKRPKPMMFLKVIPLVDTGVPISINRSIECSGYWDYSLTCIKTFDADMMFIDYFDFDMVGFRDFQYCRVRIVASDLYPDLIGRDALIESNNVIIELV